MSEAPVAPAPTAAPAPAPAPVSGGEVPINPNPVNAPTPVGSQAPERAVEHELERGSGRPETRRESIRRAFEKTNAELAKKEPTAKAKARLDDRSKDGPPADQKLNLRQRPEPHREQGRFARRPDAEPGTQPGAQGQQLEPGARPGQPGQQGQPAAPGKAPAPLPETAPYREAPPRWSERGRAEWAAAPESVRGEVYRMAQEFDGAYRKYKADNDTMNTIRQFHEMATQHGTTLARALNNYVSMEQKLRSDVVGGLDVIVNNLNLRTQDGRKLGLRDVAYHILNQTPEQHRLVQHENSAQAATHRIGELHQMVGSLAQTVQQMQHAQQFGHTRGAVDAFADDGQHPRFDELGDLIEQELAHGYDLETAYRRAELLRPPRPGQAPQTRTNTPAQTRSDKSIHGAPDTAPSNGRERRSNDKPIGRREAISNAIKRVNGRV